MILQNHKTVQFLMQGKYLFQFMPYSLVSYAVLRLCITQYINQGWYIAVLSMFLCDCFLFIMIYYPYQCNNLRINALDNDFLYYNLLNICYNLFFNCFITYLMHKLRLLSFAEMYFNT